ncbi:hypothetical protein SAMN05720591_11743 [Halolactibacillus alkaliphilus]|nr:hypothetical protein SAMN05720591_11743 [Halolactibacillus alkaliphilus]
MVISIIYIIRVIRSVLILLGFVGLLWALYILVNENTPSHRIALFSWEREIVTTDVEATVDFLKQYEIERLFQSFSSRLSDEEIVRFMESVGGEVDVYRLMGTPEWAFDEEATSMIREADRVIALNEQLPELYQIKGLVVDVEPYTMQDFDWDDRDLQSSFSKGMVRLFQYLSIHGLEMITVVPYFYDTKGYREVLDILIREASTELAIMNYYRESEVENMRYEAGVAKEEGVPITTIYEFKPAGEHDLTERNTYHLLGVEAALDNLLEIKSIYHNQEIFGAFHDFKALREVVGHD